MRETKHSKAPWQLAATSDLRIEVRDANDNGLMDCWSVEVPHEENIANAKLVAAAPLLLKALNSLILSVMAHPDYVLGGTGDEWHDLIDTAIEASKKATE